MTPWSHRSFWLSALAAAALGLSGLDLAAAESSPSGTANEEAPSTNAPIVWEHPTAQQYLNGSLNGKMVEIRGIIERLNNRQNGWSQVELRTTEGVVVRIELRRSTMTPKRPLEEYDNAIIRLRGKVNAEAYATGRVKSGQLRIYYPEILVDQPAPTDLFAISNRTAAAVTLIDPEYSPFRPVKISGQIVFVRGSDHFAMDGKDGFRFITKQRMDLRPGDQVEAVGFPEVSGAAPVLRGAVVRKTGQAPLPAPRKISADELIDTKLDAIRVSVEGVLGSIRQTDTNIVMEMQSGSWRFLARLNASRLEVPKLALGSRLELTGVYCAQGGYKSLGEDVAAVDLWLLSPTDIRVLTTPSWWTLARLLTAMSLLGGALIAMAIWNTQLRRKVEQRTQALTVQIQERQRVEQLQALESERTRIAQDLHDELGSDITEIAMLAARAKAAPAPAAYLEQMSSKTREMVTALDEIVWAMNPAHDSLASLVTYCSLYADRFLGLAGIHWHPEGTADLPECVLDSHQRHQLFLAYKEALTNIVKHARASETWIRFNFQNQRLTLTVRDNGTWQAPAAAAGERNGTANMRSRVEKLGGQLELIGGADGTTVEFTIPINKSS